MKVKHQVTGETNRLSGVRELLETLYPAFPGSNATNLYVYFVELFSESQIPKFLKERFKILTYFVSMIHDS